MPKQTIGYGDNMFAGNPSPTDGAYLEQFKGSLPTRYHQKYSEAAIEAHARLAASRRGAPIVVALFEYDPGAEPAVCVAAKDQPGLLATVTAAFDIEGFDVVNAEAYTRQAIGGENEALDIFWAVRRGAQVAPFSPDLAGLSSIERTIVALLRSDPLLNAQRRSLQTRARTETHVRFVPSDDGALGVLEIETDDRSGLLSAITQALFQASVQIVGSEVKTHGNRVHDRFEITERDGTPIGDQRRLELQVAVLGALERG